MRHVGTVLSATLLLGVLEAGPAAAEWKHPEPIRLFTDRGIFLYEEGSDPQPMAPRLKIRTDPAANIEALTRARVKITSNFRKAQDKLFWFEYAQELPTSRLAAPVQGTYNSGTGILTFKGEAPVSEYQRALRSVAYRNSSDDPSPLTRRISMWVEFDDEGNVYASNVLRLRISITPVNDAPELQTTAQANDCSTADSEHVVVDPGLRVRDADDETLESAVVRIATGLESQDRLEFTDQLGITGTYDSGTGILTLTGTASVADYQAALRSVRYGSAGNTKPTLDKTVEFVARDMHTPSSVAVRELETSTCPW